LLLKALVWESSRGTITALAPDGSHAANTNAGLRAATPGQQ
jgi:hypothetical protein